MSAVVDMVLRIMIYDITLMFTLRDELMSRCCLRYYAASAVTMFKRRYVRFTMSGYAATMRDEAARCLYECDVILYTPPRARREPVMVEVMPYFSDA